MKFCEVDSFTSDFAGPKKALTDITNLEGKNARKSGVRKNSNEIKDFKFESESQTLTTDIANSVKHLSAIQFQQPVNRLCQQDGLEELQKRTDQNDSMITGSVDDNNEGSWWECDFCGRAFSSLEGASKHEQRCSQNPASCSKRSCAVDDEFNEFLRPTHGYLSPVIEVPSPESKSTPRNMDAPVTQSTSAVQDIYLRCESDVEVSTPPIQLFSRLDFWDDYERPRESLCNLVRNCDQDRCSFNPADTFSTSYSQEPNLLLTADNSSDGRQLIATVGLLSSDTGDFTSLSSPTEDLYSPVSQKSMCQASNFQPSTQKSLEANVHLPIDHSSSTRDKPPSPCSEEFALDLIQSPNPESVRSPQRPISCIKLPVPDENIHSETQADLGCSSRQAQSILYECSHMQANEMIGEPRKEQDVQIGITTAGTNQNIAAQSRVSVVGLQMDYGAQKFEIKSKDEGCKQSFHSEEQLILGAHHEIKLLRRALADAVRQQSVAYGICSSLIKELNELQAALSPLKEEFGLDSQTEPESIFPNVQQRCPKPLVSQLQEGSQAMPRSIINAQAADTENTSLALSTDLAASITASSNRENSCCSHKFEKAVPCSVGLLHPSPSSHGTVQCGHRTAPLVTAVASSPKCTAVTSSPKCTTRVDLTCSRKPDDIVNASHRNALRASPSLSETRLKSPSGLLPAEPYAQASTPTYPAPTRLEAHPHPHSSPLPPTSSPCQRPHTPSFCPSPTLREQSQAQVQSWQHLAHSGCDSPCTTAAGRSPCHLQVQCPCPFGTVC